MAREITGINFEIFKDWTGKRYTRSFQLGNTKETEVVEENGKQVERPIPFDYKLETNIPVPDWKDCPAFFGLSDADAAEIFVRHLSTDRDTAVRKYINSVKHDVDWDGDTTAVQEKCAEIFEPDMKTAPERKLSDKAAKRKEEKEKANSFEAMMAKFKCKTPQELMEKIAKMEAKSK